MLGVVRLLSAPGTPLWWAVGFIPKFCAKIVGVKTIQIAPNLAYFLRFEVLDTEGCQHDKATRPISNAP